jgi:hypothetical protein
VIVWTEGDLLKDSRDAVAFVQVVSDFLPPTPIVVIAASADGRLSYYGREDLRIEASRVITEQEL